MGFGQYPSSPTSARHPHHHHPLSVTTLLHPTTLSVTAFPLSASSLHRHLALPQARCRGSVPCPSSTPPAASTRRRFPVPAAAASPGTPPPLTPPRFHSLHYLWSCLLAFLRVPSSTRVAALPLLRSELTFAPPTCSHLWSGSFSKSILNVTAAKLQPLFG